MIEKDYGLPTKELLSVFQRGPDNKDYILTTNFSIKIVRCPILSYFVQSVSISDTDAAAVRHPFFFGPQLQSPSNTVIFSEFTVKYLVNEDLSNYAELSQWMRESAPYKDFREVKPLNEVLSEAFIIVTTNRKNPLLKIAFHNIFPVEMSGFDFTNTDGENTPITATAKFAITEMEFVDL